MPNATPPRLDRATLAAMLDAFGRESRSFVLGRVNDEVDRARRAILDYCCPETTDNGN